MGQMQNTSGRIKITPRKDHRRRKNEIYDNKIFREMSSRFVHLCSTGTLKQILEVAPFIKDETEIITGLYWACYNGDVDKVKFLMTLLTGGNVTLKHLRTACVPYYDDNLDGHLKTVEILLANFSFNIPDLDKFINDITMPYIEHASTYAIYLESLKPLLTEYYYRLDGPGYNQNIIS